MQTLTTIIFPNTIPSTEQLTSLLPLFEPVVYCRPVENDNPKLSDEFQQLCDQQTLCRLKTPAPLGNDRERERIVRQGREMVRQRMSMRRLVATRLRAILERGARPGIITPAPPSGRPR